MSEAEGVVRAPSLLDALGGDPTGSRVANMLNSHGIHTLSALYALRQSLGEKSFASRMRRVRNVGDKGIERIIAALDVYEASGRAERDRRDLSEGSLPDGLLLRMRNTLITLHERGFLTGSQIVRGVTSPSYDRWPVEEGGLTVGDLIALDRLFTGSSSNGLKEENS